MHHAYKFLVHDPAVYRHMELWPTASRFRQDSKYMMLAILLSSLGPAKPEIQHQQVATSSNLQTKTRFN
jgi:hypothetical protein